MSILLRDNITDPFALDFWNPFDALTTLALRSPISGYASSAAAAANTPIDWKETPAAHVFKADLPGVRKDDVKVEVEDGRVLQIAGERRREPPEAEEESVRWHRVERGAGKFLRRFRLPENVKEEGVRAFMENGVLTVVVPKEEVKKPEVKAVEISGGCC